VTVVGGIKVAGRKSIYSKPKGSAKGKGKRVECELNCGENLGKSEHFRKFERKTKWPVLKRKKKTEEWEYHGDERVEEGPGT